MINGVILDGFVVVEGEKLVWEGEAKLQNKARQKERVGRLKKEGR